MSDPIDFVSSVESLAKFPEENPNPVLRVGRDGKLLYANTASAFMLDALGVAPGAAMPESIAEAVAEAFADGKLVSCEVECRARIYAIGCAAVEEAGATT
jgi:hypothetical protein